MRRFAAGALAASAAVALIGAATQGTAFASPPSAHDHASAVQPAVAKAKAHKHQKDQLPDAMEAQRRANRSKAIQQVLHGQAKAQQRGESKVVKLGKNNYAQIDATPADATKVDHLLAILCEFGDQVDPRTGGEAGPVHNQIAQPNRRLDNSTYWESDFSSQHFKDMFFGQGEESFADFYLKQSSGAYTVTGDVSDWVTVPYNESRYGSNSISEADGYWNFVKDCTNAWYEHQVAVGMSDEEIANYLSQFDVWDRYDYDGDGNFDEPDGYVDHIEVIHAGEGEEAGGGVQGSDAIWSHSWSAFPGAPVGPEFNMNGGVQVGGTGIWVRNYTTEPENGGLGVFAHEYGHDLGLPDEYDTAGGENGTGFWTLMSSGSWLGHGENSIGTTPGYMNAWDKLQLGWLDYEVTTADHRSTHKLGVAERLTNRAQALVVVLPPKTVSTHYNDPFSGSYEWWGGSADELDVSMAHEIDLTGTSSATLTAKSWYDIEFGFDFGYLEASADGGQTWTQVGDPLTGSSDGEWTDLTYDLSAFAGQDIWVRFHYQTDGGVHYAGWFLDDIAVTADGETIFSDDVESGTNGWQADGFTRMTGTLTENKGRYYIAENRQYVDYDTTLARGPYLFGNAHTKPNWVQHFPYQDGLLIWFWNEVYDNNNTSVHPGGGMILPFDATPKVIRFTDGSILNNRRQPFDATFGLDRTDRVTWYNEVKHGNGNWQIVTATAKSHKGVRVFDDTRRNEYWRPANSQNSVKTAGIGVQIQVKNQRSDGRKMTVVVRPTD